MLVFMLRAFPHSPPFPRFVKSVLSISLFIDVLGTVWLSGWRGVYRSGFGLDSTFHQIVKGRLVLLAFLA